MSEKARVLAYVVEEQLSSQPELHLQTKRAHTRTPHVSYIMYGPCVCVINPRAKNKA